MTLLLWGLSASLLGVCLGAGIAEADRAAGTREGHQRRGDDLALLLPAADPVDRVPGRPMAPSPAG